MSGVSRKAAHDAPRTLRLLQLLALAIATVVGMGMASPGQSVARAAGSVEAAANGVSLTRWVLGQASQHWRGDAPRQIADLDAVEVDMDDDGDGDAHPDVADDPTLSFARTSSPRNVGIAPRAEASIARSRSAIRTGLPRGPPV